MASRAQAFEQIYHTVNGILPDLKLGMPNQDEAATHS